MPLRARIGRQSPLAYAIDARVLILNGVVTGKIAPLTGRHAKILVVLQCKRIAPPEGHPQKAKLPFDGGGVRIADRPISEKANRVTLFLRAGPHIEMKI